MDMGVNIGHVQAKPVDPAYSVFASVSEKLVPFEFVFLRPTSRLIVA